MCPMKESRLTEMCLWSCVPHFPHHCSTNFCRSHSKKYWSFGISSDYTRAHIFSTWLVFLAFSVILHYRVYTRIWVTPGTQSWKVAGTPALVSLSSGFWSIFPFQASQNLPELLSSVLGLLCSCDFDWDECHADLSQVFWSLCTSGVCGSLSPFSWRPLLWPLSSSSFNTEARLVSCWLTHLPAPPGSGVSPPVPYGAAVMVAVWADCGLPLCVRRHLNLR